MCTAGSRGPRENGRTLQGEDEEKNTVKKDCVCLFPWLGYVWSLEYALCVLGFVCWLVGWLLNSPSNMLVYLRDGSAQTILRAATLR